MKVVFFRNIKDFDQLRDKTVLFNGIKVECEIIKEINISEIEFKAFISNFLKSYDFLLEYVDLAIVAGDVWHGVLVRDGKNGIVVVMNGYQYPRFVGIYDET